MLGVLLVAASVSIFFLTREDAQPPAVVDSTTTTIAGPAAGVYAVQVADAGASRVVGVVAPTGDPKIVLGIPSETLVQGPSGFAPLEPLLQGAEEARGLDSIAKLVGRLPEGAGALRWSDLRAALVQAAAPGTWPEALAGDPRQAADTVARGLSALAAASSTPSGGAALDSLAVTGASDGVKASLRALGSQQGVVAALPGKAVAGADFSYYEPDAPALARLLGTPSAGGGISVEVQNGSGAVGVAEKAAEAVAPLGFEMLPVKNADEFPDVEVTRIYAAADAVAQADRVRGVLKMGIVVKQESLPPGRVVVVVGKDLTAESLSSGGA